jgi:ribbon-helix-helix CopG family protein
MARFTASINDQLKEQLDAYADENGYNRSEALELMIRTFFESKAEAPQPSPPAVEPPASRLNPTRLDQLEARLAEVQAFLGNQHDYLSQLHDVVVSNVDAHLEVYSRSGIDLELYVPSVEPATLEWSESSPLGD